MKNSMESVTEFLYSKVAVIDKEDRINSSIWYLININTMKVLDEILFSNIIQPIVNESGLYVNYSYG
jgi:hypothetical protein